MFWKSISFLHFAATYLNFRAKNGQNEVVLTLYSINLFNTIVDLEMIWEIGNSNSLRLAFLSIHL